MLPTLQPFSTYYAVSDDMYSETRNWFALLYIAQTLHVSMHAHTWIQPMHSLSDQQCHAAVFSELYASIQLNLLQLITAFNTLYCMPKTSQDQLYMIMLVVTETQVDGPRPVHKFMHSIGMDAYKTRIIIIYMSFIRARARELN